MIYVGIDDTDVIDSPGTNQLARRLAGVLAPSYRTELILRHQLLDDPRVPYTSQNGCAAMLLTPHGIVDLPALIATLRGEIASWSPVGSDPGLCVTERVGAALEEFGRRCQHEVIEQRDARELAASEGAHLEGLGGTEGGVIGALAAVGLASAARDGRVLYSGRASRDWYDVGGVRTREELNALGVDAIVCAGTGAHFTDASIDVGKRLRANYRQRRVVLFVERAEESVQGVAWRAVRRD